MPRFVSDGERLAMAMLNKKETELATKDRELKNYIAQLRAMTSYIWELKESNKILASQLNYLISKQIHKC